MKGFRTAKKPSKAELEKLVEGLRKDIQVLARERDLYKKIATRMRNCKNLDELKELRENMQTAKESVIFANKTEDGKLIDPKT